MSKTVTAVFKGAEITLREMSWPMAVEARDIFQDLARAGTRLLNDKIFEKAQGSSFETVEQAGGRVESAETKELSQDSIRLQISERRGAAEELVGIFLLPKNAQIVAKILIDACPDITEAQDTDAVFDENGIPKPLYWKSLMKKLSLSELTCIMPKVLEVNLAPLGEMGKALMERAKARVQEAGMKPSGTTSDSGRWNSPGQESPGVSSSDSPSPSSPTPAEPSIPRPA